MDLLGGVASGIMTPLYYGVTALLLIGHWVFSQFLATDSGWAWALAIVGMTVTVRVLLLPLSVRQIRSSRMMHLLQPRIAELQKEFGHDRKRLTEEQMKLWKESGTNPFSSCLPLLLQMPVFLALWQVVDKAAKLGAEGARGFLSGQSAESLSNAELLGASIADTFVDSADSRTKVLILTLVVVMCVAQFATQWQLMHNLPPKATDVPYAQQQKVLLHVLPLVFAIGGIYFPLGVVIFWATWYLWTLAEQSSVLRNSPPTTPDGEIGA